MKRYLYIAALAFSGAVHAAPVTIDFEEFALNTSTNSLTGVPPLQSKGFDISGYGQIFPYYPDPLYVAVGQSGSKSLVRSSLAGAVYDPYYGGVGVVFTLNRSDDGAFALYDFDFFANNNGRTFVMGYTVGGGTVDLATALGTGGWLNLEYVHFISAGNAEGVFSPSYASGELDNIVVSAVPIPAAVWLFGSGLGLLGFLRRFR